MVGFFMVMNPIPKDLDPSYGNTDTPEASKKGGFWHPMTSQGFLGMVESVKNHQINKSKASFVADFFPFPNN